MPTVSGTVHVARHKPKLAVAGKEKEKGTSAVARHKPHISGAGAEHFKRIFWDTGERFYSQGISNAVLYPKNSPGVAWNGLVSVTEKGDNNSTALYLDGQLYRNRAAGSSFSGTISAYMYPDEFEPYNGVVKGLTGQSRQAFGFSYRTNREIHIVYNVLAEPSNDKYETLGANTNPVSFSWSFTTLPKDIPDGRPSSHLVVMLDYAHAGAISDLEDLLYGNDMNAAALPEPQVIFELFDSYATLRITDNHDGTWTATGSDAVVSMIASNEFQIDWESAVFIDADSYQVRSL